MELELLTGAGTEVPYYLSERVVSSELVVVSREVLTQRVKQSGTTQYRYSPTHAPTAYSRAYCLLTRLLLTYAPTALLTRLLPYRSRGEGERRRTALRRQVDPHTQVQPGAIVAP